MRKILIVILILHTYISIGQIPLMVNNKPNKKIHSILEKKYSCYKDSCLKSIERDKKFYKHHYDLKVNDLKIKVFGWLYFKNNDLKLDSTINIMNELLVDTTSSPADIQFFKDNIFWGWMGFGFNGVYLFNILDDTYYPEVEEKDREKWKEIYAFKADNIFRIKGYDSYILQKGHNIYFYDGYKWQFPFNERMEPLDKYIKRKNNNDKFQK